MTAILIGAILAFDKETLMLGAFGSMVAAGVVVAVGAIVLFVRERRAARATGAPAATVVTSTASDGPAEVPPSDA